MLSIMMALVLTGQEPATRDDLAALVAQAREAHLNRDAALMVSVFADDMIAISGGEVRRASRDAGRERFEAYFGRVDFMAWDDLEPPIITLSDDGSMATVMVRKLVRVRPRGQVDAPVSETRFAWLEVWRRVNGRWEMTANVSTNVPSIETPPTDAPPLSPP